jgi:hypothetical protein
MPACAACVARAISVRAGGNRQPAMKSSRARHRREPCAEHAICDRVAARRGRTFQMNLPLQITAVQQPRNDFGHDRGGHPAGRADSIDAAVAELLRRDHRANSQTGGEALKRYTLFRIMLSRAPCGRAGLSSRNVRRR